MKIVKVIDKLSESRLTSVWEFAFEVRKAITKIEDLFSSSSMPSKTEESFKKKYLIGRGDEAVHPDSGWITIYEHKFSLEKWRDIDKLVIFYFFRCLFLNYLLMKIFCVCDCFKSFLSHISNKIILLLLIPFNIYIFKKMSLKFP